MKTSILTLTIASLLTLVLFTGMRHRAETYHFDYENVLGTSLELKVKATSEQAAEYAETIALQEIDRLDGILSTYKPESEFSRWQRTSNTPVVVSPELFEVMTLFDFWKNTTGGALNASAKVATVLWKAAEVNGKVPSDGALQLAVAKMNRPHWALDADNQTARHLSMEPLVFNSFVKSYIINKVSDLLMTQDGVTGVVVNIGGDIVIAGDYNEKIKVTNPVANGENDSGLATLILSNSAIATSGNYRRGFQVNDQWFSHILDARTGWLVSEVISATVVANNASDAGALATAFNILTPEESANLAESIPGVAYQIVTRSGEEFVNDKWHALEKQNVNNAVEPIIAAQEFEMTITLELARFEGRFRRPFVAVWIENTKKEPVRNLAVWYNKSRWLPDLKKWYSKNYESMVQGNLQSVTSATRAPGQYTLTWDGLNSQGKPVPSGKYTIYIEAAREHGTYQLIKQDVEWNGKPKHLDIAGGTEITAASIDYHKVLITEK